MIRLGQSEYEVGQIHHEDLTRLWSAAATPLTCKSEFDEIPPPGAWRLARLSNSGICEILMVDCHFQLRGLIAARYGFVIL